MLTKESQPQVLARIRGTSATVPDLHKILEGFPPRKTSAHVDRVGDELNKWLDSIDLPSKLREKLKAAKIHIFSASWWPFENYEAVVTTTFFAAWLFMWDDVTDTREFSPGQATFEGLEDLRKNTTAYVKYLLIPREGEPVIKPATPIVSAFKDVIKHYVTEASYSRRDDLCRMLEQWINCTRDEHELQLIHGFPRPETYMMKREGTSAVRAALEFTKYYGGFEPRADKIHGYDGSELQTECNTIVSIINDIFSARKELAQGQTIGLIPILCAEFHCDLQEAVDRATQMLRESVVRFNNRALRLQKDAPEHEADEIADFVLLHRTPCTATLDWHLTSPRYQLQCESLEGEVRFTVD